MHGPAQGVLAMVALDKISKEVKELMASIEKSLEVDSQDIETIRAKLKAIADENAKRVKPSKK